MRNPVRLALAAGALLFLGACADKSETPTPRIIDMGSLVVNAGATPVVTVTDPDSHAYTFASAGALQHTVRLAPSNASQDPDMCVFQGDYHTSIDSLIPVGCSTNGAGVTDTIPFIALASTTYTIEVFNGSAVSPTASYTLAVTQP